MIHFRLNSDRNLFRHSEQQIGNLKASFVFCAVSLKPASEYTGDCRKSCLIAKILPELAERIFCHRQIPDDRAAVPARPNSFCLSDVDCVPPKKIPTVPIENRCESRRNRHGVQHQILLQNSMCDLLVPSDCGLNSYSNHYAMAAH